MAGADRMTIEEVVNWVLLDEHADVIREAVKAVAAEMMEPDVSELIDAQRGDRRPEDRATQRNGDRAGAGTREVPAPRGSDDESDRPKQLLAASRCGRPAKRHAARRTGRGA